MSQYWNQSQGPPLPPAEPDPRRLQEERDAIWESLSKEMNTRLNTIAEGLIQAPGTRPKPWWQRILWFRHDLYFLLLLAVIWNRHTPIQQPAPASRLPPPAPTELTEVLKNREALTVWVELLNSNKANVADALEDLAARTGIGEVEITQQQLHDLGGWKVPLGSSAPIDQMKAAEILTLLFDYQCARSVLQEDPGSAAKLRIDRELDDCSQPRLTRLLANLGLEGKLGPSPAAKDLGVQVAVVATSLRLQLPKP